MLAEGLREDVDEFVRRLKALTWQAMALRGDEREELAAGEAPAARRRLPAQF